MSKNLKLLKTVITGVLLSVLVMGLFAAKPASAATKSKKTETNIVSTKVDTDYIKTIKDNGKSWYVINTNYLNMERMYVMHFYGHYGVGIYTATLPDKSDTYQAVGIYDYETGKVAEIEAPYTLIKGVGDGVVWVEGEYSVVVNPDGTSSRMTVFACYDMNGKRVSDIDFTNVVVGEDIHSVTFYRNGEPRVALMDNSGKLIFETAVKSDKATARKVLDKYVVAGDNKNSKYYDLATGKEITKAQAEELVKDIDPELREKEYTKYPDIYKIEEKRAFEEKYGSKWDSVTYLGCNRFRVIQKPKGEDWIISIVDGNNKVLFTDKSGYQYSETVIVDNTIWFITTGERSKEIAACSYVGIMDVNCKEVVAPDNYLSIEPIDGAFLASKEWAGKNDDMNYNCLLSTKGKELVSAHIFTEENTEIYGYYEGQAVSSARYLGYSDASLPHNVMTVISTDYEFVKNNVSTSILTFPDEMVQPLEPYPYLSNCIAAYKAAAKKKTIPAVMAWHLYCFVSELATPVYRSYEPETWYSRPQANKEPLYNIDKKGNRIVTEPKVYLTSDVDQPNNKLTVSWNKYLDVDDYILEYGSESDFAAGKQKVREYEKFMPTKLVITFTKDHDYIFRVKAVDKDKNALIDWVEMSVSVKYVDPYSQLPKTSLTYKFDVKTNKLTLTFKSIKNAKKYILEYGYVEDFENGTQKTSKREPKSPYTFTYTVKKDGKMKFRIQAVDSKGEALSQWCEITIDVAMTKLDITSAKSTASKKITLTWTAVKGAASYQLYYKKAGTNDKAKSVSNSTRITKTTYTATLPKGNTDYVFQLRALDSKGNVLFGWTDWSEAYHVK